MSGQPVVQYASRTDVGMRRSANQDSLAVRLCRASPEWEECGHLFVVADGMGGHSVGDLASRITVETLPLAYFKIESDSVPDRLLTAVTTANRAIHDKARENPEFADMGTTCSALVLSPHGAYVGHVGDSRVYRIRSGEIQQLTFDHSLQWEMVRLGRATLTNVDTLHPRNVITRCLGPDQDVTIDVEGPFHVQTGDHFVLCSDGLTNHVKDSEIGAIASGLGPAEASRLLVDIANCRGGSDNTTVVVVRVDDFPQLTGEFVDAPLPVANQKKVDPNQKSGFREILSRISLYVFLLLGVSGLGCLALKQVTPGLLLICPALILGFLRFIALQNRPSGPEAGDTSEPAVNSSATVPEESGIAAASPYRRTSAKPTQEFLGFLSAAQSELVQAARDNGWEVDFDTLSRQDVDSVQALREGKLRQFLSLRASAIDSLMKEFYARARR
ncbi:MAG: protein phosphatase 2C domain-containing protein [Planctomycetaceae bacterium]